MDSGAFETCTSPKDYGDPPLSDGWHRFEVRAKDEAGNTDGSPAGYDFRVDTTKPDTKLLVDPRFWDLPSNPSNDSTPTFDFQGIDDVSNILYFMCAYSPGTRVDVEALSYCGSSEPIGNTGTFTLPELSTSGTYTFAVAAVDGWGRRDDTPATYTWQLDLTTPGAPVISSPSSDSYDTDGIINLTGTAEEGSTVKVYDDSTSLGKTTATGGSWSFTTSALSESTTAHSLTATATGTAGNTSAASNAVRVRIDKSAPTSSATAKDSSGNSYSSGTLTNKDVTVSLSAADGSSGSGIKEINYSINGGATKTYDPTKKILVSSEGESTISYYATDYAGNQESPAKTFTVNLDRSPPPPDTTISTGPAEDSTVDTNSATFDFTSDQDGSTFECKLDTGSFGSCTSPKTYNNLSNRQHTFQVRATNSGVTDSSPATRKWTVAAITPPTASPHITGTDPINGDTSVAKTIKPTVTFDTDLKSETVNKQNVKLQVYNPKKKKWLAVSSTPSYDNKVITVSPDNPLGGQKKYRVVLNTNIESTADKSLEKPFSLKFTTIK
jgi:large repetitive protein